MVKLEGLIAVTYRCNAKCYMCNTWNYPSKVEDEIQPSHLESLPEMKFTNITGGEPFVRQDLEDIIKVVQPKTKRIVISTNGYFTERIIKLAEKYPWLGIRISIEGLPKTNDELRGIRDGFDHGVRTLIELQRMGLKDIGFGITVSDKNAKDLIPLYHLACALDMEFATAIVHNNYYFHKMDNVIEDKGLVAGEFKKLIHELFKSKKPKSWFRAYFNHGIVNYVYGNKRLLPCEMGSDVFFVDPFGEIRPCNAMEESMGSLKKQKFDEIWQSAAAVSVRAKVRKCEKNCWMVGSAAPAMKKNVLIPIKWILANKWASK
ncbi:MAG: radical SAM protein [Elusimicrobiota bacterium]